jgi:hypothetical protein
MMNDLKRRDLKRERFTVTTVLADVNFALTEEFGDKQERGHDRIE